MKPTIQIPVKYLIFTQLILGLACFHSHAEINFQEMKGVHHLFKSEFEYLSPIYGWTLLGTKTLENMRFYGNYGPKKEGMGCLEKATRIHERLVVSQDCPQDRTAELIQRLFPSQDGVNLVANQIDSDPVSHLKPETLGKVLSQMAHFKRTDLNHPEDVRKLTSDLKNTLFEDLNPLAYHESRRSASEARLKQLNRLAKNPSKSQDPIHCHEVEILALQNQVSSIKEILKNLNLGDGSSAGGPLKGKGKEADFEEIATLLVDALKESELSPQHYPSHLPEQILLAYFWKKGNEKRDFIRLMEGLEKGSSSSEKSILAVDSVLKDPEKQSEFLKQKYTQADFESASFSGRTTELAARLLRDPERLVFYAQQELIEQSQLPPILSYGSARHSSLSKDKDAEHYSDCGETSLRNFLNIAVYNKKNGKFDVQYLDDFKEKNPELQFHPNLKSFYQKNSDPATAASQSVHDDWSESVTSRHSGITYLKPRSAPQCEIKASLDNSMNVLDRLLFLGKSEKDSIDPENSSPIQRAKTRSEKLDVLCKSLSTEGFELSWSLAGGGGDPQQNAKVNHIEYPDIEFSVNGQPSFVWGFHSGHSSLHALHKPVESWTNLIAEEVSHELAKPGNVHSPLLLHWFANEGNWNGLKKNLGSNSISGSQGTHSLPTLSPFEMNLYFSLPLSTRLGKDFAFMKILRDHVTPLYPTAKKLMEKVPASDPFLRKQFYAELIEQDYPWGDPPHVLGNPSIKYIRVAKDTALTAALTARHGSSFEKAWKDPRGLIWGDVVKDQHGFPQQMSLSDAEEYCHSIQARLPTKKEWEALSQDLGDGSAMGYIPQFLPGLADDIFWILPDSNGKSSTGNSNQMQAFHGLSGKVMSQVRYPNLSVRCVVGP